MVKNPPVSDLNLLSAWQDGDQAAGQELFLRHFDRLLQFFWNKVPCGAEDLVQETLLACHVSRSRIEVPFSVYLYAVARRRLLAHWEKAYRTQRRIEPLVTSAAEVAKSPTTLIVEKEETRLLLRALRDLPVDHQLLLELFYWENLSGRELAVVLEIPEGTVRTRLRRARAMLEEAITRLADSPRLAETTSANLDTWANQVALLAPATQAQPGDDRTSD